MSIKILVAATLASTCFTNSPLAVLDLNPIVRVIPTQDLACETGTPGLVELSFTLLGTGIPDDISVVMSEPLGLYDQRTIELFRQWRYKPLVKDGKIHDRKDLTIRFEYIVDGCTQ